ncbi:hypothetical protein [Nitrosococcus wardiae]|uniref:PcRGLX/YetA-like central beta-sandwich domain-containing protein n=1 Tax=Nitrosococcus wardiae TaxID=1814290 RepID=A0A4P7C0X3_9GAMM|nr:hypothetical protein [Nitrosococcus wardiae]QBQ54512.1 hypothetical protein E3U44_08325 [Nitrosococcus wardiae]
MHISLNLSFFFLLTIITLASGENSAASNSKIHKLEEKLDRLLLNYTELHPEVVILKQKIADLKEEVRQKNRRLEENNAKAQPSQTPAVHPSPKKTPPPTSDKKHTVISKPDKKGQPALARREDLPPRKINEDTDLFGKKGTLRVPLQVKETAGVVVKSYPITTVVPLPLGQYHNTKAFRIIDSAGDTIPAQFNIVNRWWARDNSIRHLMINFQPTVSAFSGQGTGIARYYLQDDSAGNTTKTPLKVKQTSNLITVITGPIKFTVDKKKFNILDKVWFDQNQDNKFDDSEKIIYSNQKNGGVFLGRLPDDVQLDSSRNNVAFEIEESGPTRVVIRAEAVTKYFNTKKHLHGFAVRIFAYANKPFIKIDYQLQNSAKNKIFSWPLYFEAMNIDFRLKLDNNPKVRLGIGDGSIYERTRENGLYLAQESHDSFKVYDKKTKSTLSSGKIADGFIDVSDSEKGVTALTRYFWQTWPNGLEIDSENKLSFQLFPEWSAQWQQKLATPHFTKTGLYWLEDMQHVYKEMLLFFHGPNTENEELINLAKTFQYHPVATLPTAWYKATRATLDMDGFIPIDKKTSTIDQRHYQYKSSNFNIDKATQYNFGWDQFLIDIHRKWGASQGGGWPYSVSSFIASENPSDYYFAEQFAMGELNVRPQWMAQYSFDKDWKFLQLTENPYAGYSWRKINGGNFRRHFDAPFIEGTDIDAKPRDDQHAWFYHMEEAYYFTGNPWIKDWYKFVGEFRKTFLHRLDPYPDPSTRGTAHALAHALQAYRITGDPELINAYQQYINKLRKNQSPIHGSISRMWNGDFRSDRASWVGYLAHTIITFMNEVKGKNWQAYAEAFNFLSGLMEWNYIYGNFAYQVNSDKGQRGSSSYGAQNLADPQAWYFLHTGKQKYLDHLKKYVKEGINGGDKVYSNALEWNGQFQGRHVQFVREYKKADLIPPKAISDLKAIPEGRRITLTWTPPLEADRYHIVWSDKPISEAPTTDKKMTNWWAANALGPDLIPTPNKKQKITITTSRSIHSFYVAIFTFDKNDNMSPMSNVVSANFH